jgi:nitrite reductase/ring-hydroxylating ferredoxin subunit
MLIRDLILGIDNPYEHLYRPSRITFETGGIFFKDLLRGVASVLRGATDDDSVKSIREIGTDEGKITTINGHKCGVYKDKQGHYHMVSARCTHLKAVLEWNGDEKTWDCPWHGSRFTVDGEVINGPAINNLAVFEEEKENIPEENRT